MIQYKKLFRGVISLGHLGFSDVGLCYLIPLFLPNLIWAKHKPEGTP